MLARPRSAIEIEDDRVGQQRDNMERLKALREEAGIKPKTSRKHYRVTLGHSEVRQVISDIGRAEFTFQDVCDYLDDLVSSADDARARIKTILEMMCSSGELEQVNPGSFINLRQEAVND